MTDENVFEDPPWTVPFRGLFDHAPRAVRILSPCVGLDAPKRAAKELKVKWESTGDFEINPKLEPALRKLGAPEEVLHIGPRFGNVCHVDIQDLDRRTDGIVSGPPCPPFSSIGKRLGDLDARASVFVAVCLWILHLAANGCLKFFIIENVEGIVKKRKKDMHSFADWFVSEITKELPRGWAVDVQHGNSITCCLPQSRPRVFFVGTAASMRASAFQRRILNAPLPFFPSVDIIGFLDHEPSEQDYLNLSMRQQVNVLEQVEGFEKDIAAAAAGPAPSSQSAPTVAICDCARDLCSSVDSQRKHGGTRTLRTNNSHPWILPSQAFQATFGPKGRLLNKAEKCRVAGIKPESVSQMKQEDIEVAIGNTIPVSLVGCIMAPVLRAWVQAARLEDASKDE